MTCIAVFTRYRPRINEFDVFRIHAVRADGSRTVCGLEVRAIKHRELTGLRPDCKRCAREPRS